MNYPVIIILGLLAIVGIILVIVFVAKGGSGGGGSSPPGPSPPGPSPPGPSPPGPSPPGPSPPGPSPSGSYDSRRYYWDSTKLPLPSPGGLDRTQWETPCGQKCTDQMCGGMRSCRDFCYDNKHWNKVRYFRISKNKTGQCAPKKEYPDDPQCYSKTSPLYYASSPVGKKEQNALPVCPESSSS